jgi:predicted MFS family arabinose efflux permease
LICLGYVAAIRLCASSLGFLPLYLDRRGYPVSDIGWIMGAGGLGSILVLPAAVLLIRRAPRRTLALGALVLGLSATLLGWATTRLSLGALHLIAAGASSLTFTCMFSRIVELTPTAHRAHGIAIFWAIVQVSNLAGPAVTEVLLDRGWSIAVGTIGIVAAIAGGLLGACAKPTLTPTPALAPALDPAPRPAPDKAFSWLTRKALAFGFIFLLVSIAWWAQSDFLTSFAHQRGIDPITPFFVGYFLVMFPARIFLGNLPERLGKHRVAAVSGLATALFFVGLLAARSSVALGLLGVIAGLGNCLSWPALYAISYTQISVVAYATAYTSFILAIARWIAGILFGRIGNELGYEGVFLTAAGAILVAAALLVAYARRDRRSSPRSTLPEAVLGSTGTVTTRAGTKAE